MYKRQIFVSNLLERIYEFAKVPPTKVIYVYKVWQSKYDEILSLGVNFKVVHDNIVDDIKSSVTGEPALIIFDDLIGSSSLKEIANLFTVDARHMNMSLVFLTQRMFINDESFRQISQNDTQTTEQSYPQRDQGIIKQAYQSNYATSLQNQHMPIEQMQTDNIEYNRLAIQNAWSRQIKYNRLPNLTYNTPVAQAKHQQKNQTSNQLVEYMETDDRLPSIT